MLGFLLSRTQTEVRSTDTPCTASPDTVRGIANAAGLISVRWRLHARRGSLIRRPLRLWITERTHGVRRRAA
jgi:hypothetical protein